MLCHAKDFRSSPSTHIEARSCGTMFILSLLILVEPSILRQTNFKMNTNNNNLVLNRLIESSDLPFNDLEYLFVLKLKLSDCRYELLQLHSRILASDSIHTRVYLRKNKALVQKYLLIRLLQTWMCSSTKTMPFHNVC